MGTSSGFGSIAIVLAVCWARGITEERLDALVESIPAGLQAVIDAGGAATEY